MLKKMICVIQDECYIAEDGSYLVKKEKSKINKNRISYVLRNSIGQFLCDNESLENLLEIFRFNVFQNHISLTTI